MFATAAFIPKKQWLLATTSCGSATATRSPGSTARPTGRLLRARLTEMQIRKELGWPGLVRESLPISRTLDRLEVAAASGEPPLTDGGDGATPSARGSRMGIVTCSMPGVMSKGAG